MTGLGANAGKSCIGVRNGFRNVVEFVAPKRYQHGALSAALEQPPAFSVGFSPIGAFHLNPTALLVWAIGRIATLGNNAFNFHAIGGFQQLEAIAEAFRVMQPTGIRSHDQLLKPRLALD
jgi:hypothetical protein